MTNSGRAAMATEFICTWFIYLSLSSRKPNFVIHDLWFRIRESSLAHNLFLSSPIVLNLCTEYDSITVVLRTIFQNYLSNKRDTRDERNVRRIEFKMGFGRISCIAQPPSCHKMTRSLLINHYGICLSCLARLSKCDISWGWYGLGCNQSYHAI